MKHVKSFYDIFENGIFETGSASSLLSWTAPIKIGTEFNRIFSKEVDRMIDPESLKKIKEASSKYGGPNVDEALKGTILDLSKKWVPVVADEISSGAFNSKGSLKIIQSIILDRVKKEISNISYLKRKAIGAAMVVEFSNRKNYIDAFKKKYSLGSDENEKYGKWTPRKLNGIIISAYEDVFDSITSLNVNRNLPKKQSDLFLDQLFATQNKFRTSLDWKGTKPLSPAQISFFDELMGSVWDSI